MALTAVLTIEIGTVWYSGQGEDPIRVICYGKRIAIGKAEARHSRSGRVALWLIALGVVALVWKQIV